MRIGFGLYIHRIVQLCFSESNINCEFVLEATKETLKNSAVGVGIG